MQPLLLRNVGASPATAVNFLETLVLGLPGGVAGVAYHVGHPLDCMMSEREGLHIVL